ncbi:putative ATP-dependent RNA helicase [Trypanosoma grayi]|uniref:putative ATP-dependent RNA helicase n=1 Tax=Trypanosoma grayi TaxID=71804 RepID=UPI0004F40563|nr:putative ATP-dependent RNA helicase [Trypanosoma grayi]KEG09655.1 putative ATP-dependent RNA helicase [Trypanosoma grayi]
MRRLLHALSLPAAGRWLHRGTLSSPRHHRQQKRDYNRHSSSATTRLHFHPIPALQVDMSAVSQIESFLKKQFQRKGTSSSTSASPLPTSGASTYPAIHILNVPRSTLKRAVLDFTVQNRPVRAVGQSKRAKRAKVLCCMHAIRLIDHFSIDGAEAGAAPPPLEEEDGAPSVVQKLHSKSTTVTRRAAAPPQPGSYKNWDDYVRESQRYIVAQEQQRCTEAYAQLRIPPSGNPLVDRAAVMTEQARSTNFLALQQLNNEIRGATKDVNVVRMAPRVFVATFILDSEAHLHATGVASTAKEAKQRGAMHALNIFKLVNEQRSLVAAGGAAVTGRGSCAPADAVALSLTPRYAKLLDFFTLLFGVVPVASFTREGSCYTCQLELDGVRCVGNGINRFEAERKALENALSEMELYDERLHSINSVIARHPNLQPQTVPTAKLPESLRNEIHVFVEQCRKELNLPDSSETPVTRGDSCESVFVENNTGNNTNNDNNNNSIDDVVDVETQATIKALEEAKHDEAYAARLRERLCAFRASPEYLERFHTRRSSLSITTVEQRILDAIDEHRVVVVCGTTGCGKTTQVPQYILDREIMAGRGDRCCIVVTQPRRLSAFSIADRIASERLDAVGNDVGYAVRLDARPGRHITLCTTGVLLQMLTGMPALDAVSHLVIDEVHERDINCDVVLALVKQLLECGNKRLKVVLMSATMQSDMFASYFGNIPVISIDGALYPVKERYLADVAKLFHQAPSMSGYYSPMFDALDKNAKQSRGRSGGANPRAKQRVLLSPLKTDYGLIARLIERSVAVDLNNDTHGKSVLVFLPGWKELVAAKQALENLRDGKRYHVILLHSSVDAMKQRECFAPAPGGKVKVVLATNIAESGITIDDAAVVIDTGLIKQTSWVSRSADTHHASHASSYATQLALQYASHANCTQRKGRAGRTQGGVCYRLFTEEIWGALPSFQEAEIHRVPLTQVLLKLLALGHTKPKETLRTFIEPPSERNVAVSMRQLQSLGAVTADEQLTPLGLYLSRLPCDPRVGKMIMMGAVLRCLDSALTMAATGDISPFAVSREVSFEVRQRRHVLAMGSQSDHISVLNAYNAFCARRGDINFARENYLHLSNMRLISRYKQQYRDILLRSGFIRDGEPGSLDLPDDEFAAYDGASLLYVESGPLSIDAADVTLVKACLCAALFPNVAVLDPTPLLHGGKKVKTLVMRTATHASISPSKDSACRRLGPPRMHGVLTPQEFFNPERDADGNTPVTPSMLYIYQNIFDVKESREEFLTQVSAVSLWALLLFGVGDADMKFDRLLGLCVVGGGWIGIHIDPSSFAALHALRSTLHACVWRKYRKPDDEANNKAIEELRRLCKAVLASPPNDREQYLNRLVDTGRILSPTEAEPLTNALGSDSDEVDGT